MEARSLVYVGDPMCSWCWGFAPVVDQLQERYGIPVEVVVGGLRPGPAAAPLDDRMREFLRVHWERVEQATGQPFDYGALERRGWTYDTELPAVAVVTVRDVSPDDALPLFGRIQRAFYAEGVDVTDPGAYQPLVEGLAVDAGRFAELLGSEQMKALAWEDFRRARALGVSGFPTLLLREGRRHQVVTRGYAPLERLDSILAPLAS